MSILDIFSKRQRRARGELLDVYTYDAIPQALRVQVVHVLQDILGMYHVDDYFGASHTEQFKLYKFIVDALCREYGVFRLDEKTLQQRHYAEELFNFFLKTPNCEYALDVVELATRAADRATRRYDYLRRPDFDEHVDNGIAELNARFREHGVGYQYEDGKLVRVDSDLLHAEAVKPALTLLRTSNHQGPRDEFLKAHEHYRHGRHEEALNDALKAFESTMKAICSDKGWAVDSRATASTLVNTCLQNGLIDPFWQTNLTALRSILESAIPTPRNRLSGHGQGVAPRTVPRELVSYVMHMTASTIVFLIESAA